MGPARGSSSRQGFFGQKAVNISRAWIGALDAAQDRGEACVWMGWSWQRRFLAQTSPVLLTRRSSAACRAVGMLASRVVGGNHAWGARQLWEGVGVTGTMSNANFPGWSPEPVGAPRPSLLTQLRQREPAGSSVRAGSAAGAARCRGARQYRLCGTGQGHGKRCQLSPTGALPRSSWRRQGAPHHRLCTPTSLKHHRGLIQPQQLVLVGLGLMVGVCVVYNPTSPALSPTRGVLANGSEGSEPNGGMWRWGRRCGHSPGWAIAAAAAATSPERGLW